MLPERSELDLPRPELDSEDVFSREEGDGSREPMNEDLGMVFLEINSFFTNDLHYINISNATNFPFGQKSKWLIVKITVFSNLGFERYN